MKARSLSTELQTRGLTRLAEWAESLAGERDNALRETWAARRKIEQLQARLHQLVSERNVESR